MIRDVRPWGVDAAHLAVIGQVEDGRDELVGALVEMLDGVRVSSLLITPAPRTPQSPSMDMVVGAEQAELVLQRHLAELHDRYTALERGAEASLDPILIVIDSLEELLATTTDPRRIHRLQLDVEAIAILGKNVRIHLLFADDEMPYLAAQARGDLGTVTIPAVDDDLPDLERGTGWYFAPRSPRARRIQFAGSSTARAAS